MKYTDLKPGMLINDVGLIISVEEGPESKHSHFYQNNPYITYMIANRAYYGMCTNEVLVDDSYEILYEQGTDEYKTVLQDIKNELKNTIKHRNEELIFIESFE